MFFLCHDLKVLEVIHNLLSIIDGIIVKNFLECILVLLREDGDDQPLILQTKLFLKETLMIVHVQHSVMQFGLPGATEQLSLFRLWLCKNFNSSSVSEGTKNELSLRYCLNPCLPCLAFLTQQSSLAFLGCGSVRILILQVFQRELKMSFH